MFSLSFDTPIITPLLLGLVFFMFFLLLFQTKKERYLLFFFLIWFPLEPLILKYTPISLFPFFKYGAEAVLYTLGIGCAIQYFRRHHRIFPTQPLNAWLLGFFFIALSSLLLNWYSPIVWTIGLRQVLRFVTLFFVIQWLEVDRLFVRHLFVFGASIIGFEAVVAFIQYAAGGRLDLWLFFSDTITLGHRAIVGGLEQFWEPGTRVFATMGRYDQLGSALMIGVIMIFACICSRTKSIHAHSVFFVLLMFALILTESRASWLAALAGILVIGVGLHRDRRVLVSFGVLCAFIFVYLGMFALTHDRVLSITEKPRQSFAERMIEGVSLRAWRESYEGYGRFFFMVNTMRVVFPSSPFFGFGPGRYGGGAAAGLVHTDVYDRLHLPFGIQNTHGQIDNNWLSLLGEFGLFGMIAWFGIYISLLRMAIFVRARTDDAFMRVLTEGFIGIVCGIALLGFFGPYFEFRTLMSYFWLLAGCVALEWRRIRGKGNLLYPLT